MVTVKVCERCNVEKSLNDDFLRDILVTDIFGCNHPVAQAIFAKMLRADRAGKSVIAREARAKARKKSMYTSGGVFIGDFPMFDVDQGRLDRVFAPITRGLYYKLRGRYLPDHYRIRARKLLPFDAMKYLPMFTEHEGSGPYAIGGDIFGCRYVVSSEDLSTSLWLLCFYGRVFFLVSSEPPAESLGA